MRRREFLGALGAATVRPLTARAQQPVIGSLRVILPFAAAIAGCASSTGVLPATPDTFILTEARSPLFRGGSMEAQRVALTEAYDFCKQRGLAFVPTLTNVSGLTSYSVTFRCLPPNDPAVAQFRQAPISILEQQER